jgi:hypothetical protein
MSRRTVISETSTSAAASLRRSSEPFATTSRNRWSRAARRATIVASSPSGLDASGALKWKLIVSHDLDLAELPRMFEAFKDRSTFFSKVIFRP